MNTESNRRPDRPYTRTEAQIEASQINGAASRGPVTAEGKSVSARNSTRHGLLSNTILGVGENKDEFEHLLAALVAELEPETDGELLMIEEMVVCKWRQIRIWGMDTAGHAAEIEAQSEKFPHLLNRPLPFRAWAAMEELNKAGNLTNQLHRYETRYSRTFFRLYGALSALKTKRDLGEKV